MQQKQLIGTRQCMKSVLADCNSRFLCGVESESTTAKRVTTALLSLPETVNIYIIHVNMRCL